MTRFIILSSSLLLLCLLGLVSSEPAALRVVPADHGCETSTDLRGYYSQQDSEFGGFHKAEIYFKTKVPSLNPDQAGVSSIDCEDGKITLKLNNRNAIKQISNWPEKVMLLISHKWKCFGQTTTQFFMTEGRTLDESKREATFTVDECNINEWAEDFSVDVSWDEGKTKKRSYQNELDKRISLPNINLSKKLSLNALFDEDTGKSSTPNIPIINEVLFCANCFVNGEATIALRLAAKLSLFKIKLTEASISLNGNVKLNLDLSLKPGVGIDVLSGDRKLLNFPIPPGLGVPNIFSIGPSIDLVASATISAGTETTINFGGEIGLPNFSAKASFAGGPIFEQSGFKPQVKSHGLKVDVDTSININSSLTPRLSFGIDILKGLFSRQAGFQLNAGLDAGITVGRQAKCKRRSQSRLKAELNGDIGFFVNDDDFPILEFPSVNLLNRCV